MDSVLVQSLAEVLLQIHRIDHLHRRSFNELHVLDIQDLHLRLHVIVRVLALLDDVVQRLDSRVVIVVVGGGEGKFIREDTFQFQPFVQRFGENKSLFEILVQLANPI